MAECRAQQIKTDAISCGQWDQQPTMTAQPTGWGHVVGTEKGAGQREAQMSSTKGIKGLLL